MNNKTQPLIFSGLSLYLSLMCARAVTLRIEDESFLEVWTIFLAITSFIFAILLLVEYLTKK